MSHDTEHRIRERAYHLWEAAGRPHGRDGEFWEQASRLEHASAVSTRAKAPKHRDAKAPAPKPATPSKPTAVPGKAGKGKAATPSPDKPKRAKTVK